MGAGGEAAVFKARINDEVQFPADLPPEVNQLGGKSWLAGERLADPAAWFEGVGGGVAAWGRGDGLLGGQWAFEVRAAGPIAATL